MTTSERLFTVLMLGAALAWSVLCFGGLFGLSGLIAPAAPATQLAKAASRPVVVLPPVEITATRARVASSGSGPVLR